MNKIKYLLVAMVALVAMTANAQFRYGPLLGLTISDLKFKQKLVTIDGNLGAQTGLQAEMMFPGIGFGIDMGLLYNMTGATAHLGDRLMWQDQGYGKERLTLHQISLPFHLRFKYTRLNGMEDYFAPFVYGGPDFNILAAHSKCDAMSFAGGDLGLTAGLGAELYKHWQVSASYTWGMTYSLKAKVLQNYSANTRQWTVRVAYLF